MRTKSIVLLGLALGCGLVASIGISQIIEQNKAAPAAATETEAIYVAKKAIAGQEQLTAENINLEQWPKHLIPPGALKKLEELDGRRVKHSMAPGEPILQNKLVGADDRRATTDVPPGYRLKAVHADAVSAVGNLIQPGDRVDVLVYLKNNFMGGPQNAGTTTILQDIKVFAVNDQWKPGDNDSEPIAVKNVSLLLTPEQVEKLTLASELGKVSLVLRSPDDDLKAPVGEGTTPSDLFGIPEIGDRKSELAHLGQSAKYDPKPSGGLLGMLGFGQKNAEAGPTTPLLASATPIDVERFTMELIEGPQARLVEFTRSPGANSRWQAIGNSSNGAPATAEPQFSLPQADGLKPGSVPPGGLQPGDAVSLTPAEKD